MTLVPSPGPPGYHECERAERALKVVRVESGRWDYNVVDLIADLCHLAQRHRLDIHQTVTDGVNMWIGIGDRVDAGDVALKDVSTDRASGSESVSPNIPCFAAHNAARADRGRTALAASGYADRVDAQRISSFVACLCGVVQRYAGIVIADVLWEGLCRYGAQCVEQALEFTDDWPEELTDPAHRERAEEVLRVCGVPQAAHDRILDVLNITGDALDEG